MKRCRQDLSPQQADQVRDLVALSLARSGFTLASPEQLDQLGDEMVGLTVNITVPGVGAIPTAVFTGRLQELHQALVVEEETLCCGGLVLDCRRRQAFIDGQLLALTPREFQLLSYLIHNPDTVLPRTQLLGSVWELSYGGDIRTVDTHIKCLRRKLGPYARHIATVRKVGYRFDSSPD